MRRSVDLGPPRAAGRKLGGADGRAAGRTRCRLRDTAARVFRNLDAFRIAARRRNPVAAADRPNGSGPMRS